jgi:hypothetical protein
MTQKIYYEGTNCDSLATVDFGHGPVEIRCTHTGAHEEHRCEVWWPLAPNSRSES